MSKVVVMRGSIIKVKASGKYEYYALYPHDEGQEKLRQLYGKVGEVDVVVIVEEG